MKPCRPYCNLLQIFRILTEIDLTVFCFSTTFCRHNSPFERRNRIYGAFTGPVTAIAGLFLTVANSALMIRRKLQDWYSLPVYMCLYSSLRGSVWSSRRSLTSLPAFACLCGLIKSIGRSSGKLNSRLNESRKRIAAYFKTLSRHLRGKPEESHRKYRS
jgi:hypothetical protein